MFEFGALRNIVRQLLHLPRREITNIPTADEELGARLAELLVDAIVSTLSVGLCPGMAVWHFAQNLERVPTTFEGYTSDYEFLPHVIFVVKSKLATAPSAVKSKAFVRQCLNDGCLLACLEMLCHMEDAQRTCFIDTALVRRKGQQWDEFVSCIAPIAGPPLENAIGQRRLTGAISFALDLDPPLLGTWQLSLPSLGLPAPHDDAGSNKESDNGSESVRHATESDHRRTTDELSPAPKKRRDRHHSRRLREGIAEKKETSFSGTVEPDGKGSPPSLIPLDASGVVPSAETSPAVGPVPAPTFSRASTSSVPTQTLEIVDSKAEASIQKSATERESSRVRPLSTFRADDDRPSLAMQGNIDALLLEYATRLDQWEAMLMHRLTVAISS